MIERIDRSRLGIVGGDESDIEKFIESDFKIRQGLCPNDHGFLTAVDWGQECPQCHFSTNVKCELPKQ